MKTKTTLCSDALGLHSKCNNLFVGLGNQAFLNTPNTCIELHRGTPKKKVHGFALSPDHDSLRLLLIYAENDFYLFKYCCNQKDPSIQCIFEGQTKDWINAAIFFDNGKNYEFVLHMAHGALLHLRWDNILDADNESGKCCVLELACCTDYSMLYSTCLHGTCYNELVVISGNSFGELLIWQTLSSVHYNLATRTHSYPLITRMQAHNGVIFAIDFNMAKKLLVTTSDDRSVKFWQVQNGERTNWEEVNVTPMFSCFGHTARVMCAIVIEYGDQVYVVSGGEDSYICIWNCLGDLLLKRRQQFGAPIWRICFDSATATLFSTGSTGNVLAYNLHSALSRKSNDQLTKINSFASSSTRDEFMANVKFVNHNLIVGLSNKHRLYYMCLKSNLQAWQLVPDFPGYKCTALAVSDGLIVTCGNQRVTLLSYNAHTEQLELHFDGTRLKGAIRGFQFLNKELYLISDDMGNCQLLRGHELIVEAQISLINGKEPWITAALLVSPQFMVLSNRSGCVMVYSRKDIQSDFHLKSKLKRLHGGMGATLLKLLTLDEQEACILSAGHESVIKFLRLNLMDGSLSIWRRECVPLSWIEASPSQDVLLGFNDNYIVAWSRQHDVLMQLQCGGGHRCWDYELHDGELSLVFVKQKQVFYYNNMLYNKSLHVRRNNWHIRSCNTLRLLATERLKDPFIVSAGDDNIIKLSRHYDNMILQRGELHSHISSIRHLAAYPLDCTSDIESWLIFSVGGRAQLCINQVMSKDGNVSELCTHTVRNAAQLCNDLVEARLMGVEVSRHPETQTFSLFIASADGKISLHHWHINEPFNLHLLCLIDLKRCPLQLKWLNNPGLLLIATTNGELCIYNQDLSTKYLKFQLHDAGVNTLDTYVDNERLHILSGGDDENVKHTIIQLNRNINVQEQIEFSGLHNAQVNGLALNCQHGAMLAYTCSMDKQIYKINLNTREYTRVGHTCIDDIKGIVLDENNRMYIYGSGLEIILQND